MLFVHITPRQTEELDNYYTLEEYRWELLRAIGGCYHQPNNQAAPADNTFTGPRSKTNCAHIADTSLVKSNFNDETSPKDNHKVMTHGKIVEYWFPNCFDDATMERIKYVEDYWKWFCEDSSDYFDVRFEKFWSYREGVDDKRNNGGEDYEYARRATHKVSPPSYPSW